MGVSSFTNREVVYVDIDHMRTGQIEPGQEIVKAHVRIHVADAYRPDARGPGVKVEIGLLPDADASLRGIEAAALAAAHDLLKRLAEEPLERLQARYEVDRGA